MLKDFILFCLGKKYDIYVLYCDIYTFKDYYKNCNYFINLFAKEWQYHRFYVKTHQSVFVFPRSLAFYNISDISSFVLCIIFRIKKN